MPSVLATTLAQLLEHIRKNPGRLNYASAGNGTSHHLAAPLQALPDYQPRSAKRWVWLISSIPMPVIGAPRPRLTLARMSASRK